MPPWVSPNGWRCCSPTVHSMTTPSGSARVTSRSRSSCSLSESSGVDMPATIPTGTSGQGYDVRSAHPGGVGGLVVGHLLALGLGLDPHPVVLDLGAALPVAHGERTAYQA